MREGVIHLLVPSDSEAYLGPHGGGGPVVPTAEFSGVWQKVWVNDIRKKNETEAGELTNSEGAVRNLMLEEELRLKEIEDDSPVMPVYRGSWRGGCR